MLFLLTTYEYIYLFKIWEETSKSHEGRGDKYDLRTPVTKCKIALKQ